MCPRAPLTDGYPDGHPHGVLTVAGLDSIVRASDDEEIAFLQSFNTDTYQEILRIRTDGVWRKRGFNIANSTFDITSEEYTDQNTGYPRGFEQIVTSGSAESRSNWLNWTYSSVQKASEGLP